MFIHACCRSILLAGLCLVTACAFYPATSKLQHHSADCNMATRSLDLDYKKMSANPCSAAGKEGEAVCLAAMGIVVPVGSFVASGSVVLVGNTLHWLEYHGTCDDGLLWSVIKGRR